MTIFCRWCGCSKCTFYDIFLMERFVWNRKSVAGGKKMEGVGETEPASSKRSATSSRDEEAM